MINVQNIYYRASRTNGALRTGSRALREHTVVESDLEPPPDVRLV